MAWLVVQVPFLLIYFFLQNATQKSQKVFVHVPSEIAAHEVEEIGTVLCSII